MKVDDDWGDPYSQMEVDSWKDHLKKDRFVSIAMDSQRPQRNLRNEGLQSNKDAD